MLGVVEADNTVYPLGPMRSHIDDTDEQGVVFSRDCPEFEPRTLGGDRSVVLVNHLESTGTDISAHPGFAPTVAAPAPQPGSTDDHGVVIGS